MNDYYFYDLDNQSGDGAYIDVKIWYQDADYGSYLESKLVIGHYDGSNNWWDAFDLDDLSAEWNRDGSNNWVQTNGPVNTFSPIGLAAGGSGPLPIELLSFSADCLSDKALLEWATASETNNDYFTVERSTDGEVFAAIATVASQGNAYKIQRYEFTDPAPFAGMNYYRLRQTDLDGQTSLAGLTSVRCAGNTINVELYPVPAQDYLIVFFDPAAGSAELNVIDVLGRVVISKQVLADDPWEVRLDLSNLEGGLYHVVVQQGELVSKLRFVKQ